MGHVSQVWKIGEVIVTVADPDRLVRIHPQLVADRPCASAELPAALSTLAGQVHDKIDGRVALRTRRRLLPCEVPSVIAAPVIDGDPDYLGWIPAVRIPA